MRAECASAWPFFVGVFDVQADNAAFVGISQGVFFFGGASDFLAVAQPLVFDAFFRYAVFVGNIGFQGFADVGFAADFNFAFVVGVGVVVADADFALVATGVTQTVTQGVFDRVGVAFFEALQRGEGDVAATADAPGALFVHHEGADFLAVLVNQFDGVGVNVALRVGVVFGDVDGGGIAALGDNAVIFEMRFVGSGFGLGCRAVRAFAGSGLLPLPPGEGEGDGFGPGEPGLGLGSGSGDG